MPSRMLPNLTSNEVALNNSSRSCWVTIGSNVYDVTEFLDAHPGGGELILEHGGEDVENIMQDEISHAHSKEAYDVLNDNLIGFVAADPVLQTAVESHRPQDILPLPPNETGAEELRANDAADFIPTHTAIETTSMRNTEDLLRDTDAPKDHRKPKFLDLDKPLLMQVWNGNFPKDFYLEEVHHGQSYKGGESAPLFGNFLEPLSKTAWWVIPLVWWPQVAWVSWITYEGIPSGFQFTAYWLTGLFLWTLVEYVMHRGLFHVDKYLPDNRVGITAHFLLHGIHHYLPMDRYRLVMPPTLFVVLAAPFYELAHTIFYWDWYVATAVFCGGIFGYTLYDCTHYFIHHKQIPLEYFSQLKSYHIKHHWTDHENGFGVTSRLWDRVFGTELAMSKPVKAS